jgi:hypothetical protein
MGYLSLPTVDTTAFLVLVSYGLILHWGLFIIGSNLLVVE